MYTKGEVVWAKIKGFPWWPGVVAKVVVDKENPTSMMEILVNFIGENSHAQLSLDKVAKFQQKYQEYAKMKKKKLLESIETANRIFRGETSYEAESIRLTDNNSKSSQSVKKRKDSSKPFEKSPSNDYEAGIGQYDSDKTSIEDMDLMSPSPVDKASKRVKNTDKKDHKKRSTTAKPLSESNIEKSPILGKAKSTVNGKREYENSINESDELILSKALKTEVSKAESKNSKETNEKSNKLEKQNSKPPVLPVLTYNLSTAETSDSLEFSQQNKNSYLDNISRYTALKPREHTFESLYELIIEKTTNFESQSISGSVIEKSIESVISKINPETVSIHEILEGDLGKSVHTLLILLDELCSSIPKAGDMDIESELAGIRDKLINFIDVIKNRLILHYIENTDYCTVWLRKLEHKREEKIRQEESEKQERLREKERNEKTKKVEEKEKLERIKKVEEKERQEALRKVEDKERLERLKRAEEREQQEAKKKAEEKTKEHVKEAVKLSKIDKINQMLDEEGEVPIKVEEEEEKTVPTLQINFDEYRYENDKKKTHERETKMVTTSTKISKATHNEGKKAENKPKEIVSNPSLRKKICLKMSKILQEKYGLTKDSAQEITLRTEAKIRHINPDMQTEYKDKVLTILKLLKFSLINIKDFANDFNIDFSSLKEQLDIYQRQHADLKNDEGLDSFCTGKDDGIVSNGKTNDFK